MPWRRPNKVFVEVLVWLALAIAGLLMSQSFDAPTPQFALSPAFWPRLALYGMIVTAVALGISHYLDKRRKPYPELPPTEAETEREPVARYKLWANFVLPILYVLAMQRLGFYLVTPFFFAAFLLLMGVRGWLTIVFVTVAFYVAIVLVFVKLLFTPMPAGGGIFYVFNGLFLDLFQ